LIIFVPSNQQVVAPAKTDKPPDGDKTTVTSSVAQTTTTTMNPPPRPSVAGCVLIAPVFFFDGKTQNIPS
ncbi:unnamed protein product, partial [Tenebrio molitor]